MNANEAQLIINYNGHEGQYPEPVPYDADDDQVRRWATEAVMSGMPGLPADSAVNQGTFADFKVSRYAAGNGVDYNRIAVRPKVEFGNAWMGQEKT